MRNLHWIASACRKTTRGVHFQVLFCFGILCWQPAPVAAQNYDGSKDKDHLLGVMDAHLSSLEGWQSFDVFLRTEINGSGRRLDEGGIVKGPDAKSAISRQTIIVRVAVDFEQERALILTRNETETRLFDALDEEIGKPGSYSVNLMAVMDKPRSIGFRQGRAGKMLKMRELPSVEALLQEMGVPNLKAFGTVLTFDSRGSQVLFDTLNYNKQLLESVSHVGKNRHQALLRDQTRSKELMPGFRVYVDWDVVDHVPLKVATYRENAEQVANVRPMSSETVGWAEINGNPVPVSSRRSYSRLTRVVDELELYFDYDQSTDLHWFSFNQEMADDLFDESILSDPKRIDELLSDKVFESK